MALRFGFFNSVGGDRKYDARWFAKYFASFIGNGIFPNPATNFQVVEHENMTVVVKAGQAWINGYYADNDADFYLTLDNADGLLNRIDRIVLRLNFIDRVIELVVKKGTFASNPVAPALQRDGDYHELVLADVLISKGTTQITQANITDTRLSNELCGIVHGLVNQVDTQTLFNQYQSWISEQKAFYEAEITQWTATQQAEFEQFQLDMATIFNNAMQNNQNEHNQMISDNQTEFDTWLANIQAVLDGDVAGNLLNLINGVRTDLTELHQQVTTHLAQNASTTQEGHVQLTNDIDSESDSMAVTPKAVKQFVNMVGVKKYTDLIFEAGDSIVYEDSSNEVSVKSLDMTLAKSVVSKIKGNVRVTFGIKRGNTNLIPYGQVYINGNTVGIERTTNLTTEVLFTEDFTVEKGDEISIYIRSTSTIYVAIMKTFRISVNNGFI